jgi:DNA-binding NtrC family response regulator
MNECKILVTDDDDIFRKSVNLALSANSECNFEIFEAKVGEEALEILKKHQNIGCIILDYNFEKYGGPGQMNGLEIAEKVKEIAPHIPIIMTSEVGDRGDIAMKAARDYIHGFLDKPFSEEQLLDKLKQFYTFNEVNENDQIKAQGILNKYGFVSVSKEMQTVCYEALIASQNDWNVLILGETGTGKTLLASIIHKLSNRANKPFISANCSAITPSLIESELFGHTKGSFTGANEEKKGLFEIASEGTLFLDEIANIPFDIQAKLNYAIDDSKVFFKVGRPDKIIKNRARIIAATLHDPKEAIEKNLLRKDIEARFTNVIRIPPIRERKEDIPLIVNLLIDRYRQALAIKKNISISPDAMNLLVRQPWQKNGHQLSSIIKKSLSKCIYRKTSKITLQSIKEELFVEYGVKHNDNRDFEDYQEIAKILAKKLLENKDDVIPKRIREKNAGGLKALLNVLERHILIEAVKRNSGNVLSTSKYLSENKDTLRNHLKKFGLDQ